MKRLMLGILVLSMAQLGCSKGMEALEKQTQLTKDDKPKIIPKGTGNLSVGEGGGAVQAVRKAAARTVNDSNMDQLHKLTSVTIQLDNRMPSAVEIRNEANMNRLGAIFEDDILILTDTKSVNGIYAYTKWPQRNEKHYVLMGSGRHEMSADELTKALQAQGSKVTLEK
jgi:hypothetical protein